MTTLIEYANGKLDNPLMLEWAIDYYYDLPKTMKKERTAIEEAWFHALQLAQLIESDETSLLNSLFRALPAKHLTGLSHLLIKHWPTWPASLSETVSEILVEIAPTELIRLYQDAIEHLPHGNHDEIFKLINVDKVLNDADNEQHCQLLEKLANAVLVFPDKIIQSMLLGPLLKSSRLLPQQTLVSLLKTASKQHDPTRQHAIWKSVFSSFFGRHDYLSAFFDNEQYSLDLEFTSLAICFDDDAPLAQFDR